MLIWIYGLAVLAAIKIVLGLVGFLLGRPEALAPEPHPLPPWINLAPILAFGSATWLLLIHGRRDRRAVFLGLAFLCVAASFSGTLLSRLESTGNVPLESAAIIFQQLYPEVFLPAFLWLFFRDFPRAPERGAPARIGRIAVVLSIFVATVLFAYHASSLIRPREFTASPHLLDLYSWGVSLLIALPALPYGIWRAASAQEIEKRRVRLFVAGLVLGLAPMTIEILLEALVPPFARWMSQPWARRIGAAILFPCLLSVPLTTSYSVLVDHVLDVRLVIRKALRYALARYSVLVGATVPFAVLVSYLYLNRDETLVGLLSGVGTVVLLIITSIGFAAVPLRRKILAAIDRKFFREQYDAQRILARLVDESRDVSSPDQLVALLGNEIDHALHLDTITVLVVDASSGDLTAPSRSIRSLGSSSALAALVAEHTEPMEITLDERDSLLGRLPDEERTWLNDGAFRLLAPLHGSDGSLLGVIALGEKLSGLPFTRDDRLLLGNIAASSALTLENRFFRSSPSDPQAISGPPDRAAAAESAREETAMECLVCGAVQRRGPSSCERCGGKLGVAPLPYMLLGKFRVEERIGTGGMGVVYRGVDLSLGRTVAIKTLPRVSPRFAMRLRREARTMAAITHPNLATIFAAETWRSSPVLIFEYLENGTLADRLKIRRYSLEETLALGSTLIDALQHMHAADILHRDIKPGNIGYTATGVVKVIDLGLARVLYDSRMRGAIVQGRHAEREDTLTAVRELDSLTHPGQIVGTPAYLSPEALRRGPPDPSYDLWSVAVVLFEALTGRHPFLDDKLGSILDRLYSAEIADLETLLPGCPSCVKRFFDEVLSRKFRRRPQTAAAFGGRLDVLQTELTRSRP
jgi:hypothetical protein